MNGVRAAALVALVLVLSGCAPPEPNPTTWTDVAVVLAIPVGASLFFLSLSAGTALIERARRRKDGDR